MDEVDHVQSLARVEPGEWFVEHDDLRVVHNRLGELDALAHALRVRRQAPGVGRVEFDNGQCVRGGRIRVGELVEHRGEPHELEGGEQLEDPLLLGHDADAARYLQVMAWVATEHADGADGRRSQATQHAHHGGLAGAVRSEQRGDARAHVERDVGDGHEVTEPLGHVLDHDERVGRRGGERWRDGDVGSPLRRRWWRRWRWRWGGGVHLVTVSLR